MLCLGGIFDWLMGDMSRIGPIIRHEIVTSNLTKQDYGYPCMLESLQQLPLEVFSLKNASKGSGGGARKAERIESRPRTAVDGVLVTPIVTRRAMLE